VKGGSTLDLSGRNFCCLRSGEEIGAVFTSCHDLGDLDGVTHTHEIKIYGERRAPWGTTITEEKRKNK